MEPKNKERRDEYFKSRSYAGMLGARLRKARSWGSLQYGDVAEALGVDRDHVRKLEKGTWLPTVWELTVLSELYGCSVDWVLGLSDDPQTRRERVEAAEGKSLEPVENLEDVDLDRCEGERSADRYTEPTAQKSRNKMCYSKRRFRTEDGAIKAAIGSSRHYGQPMRAYRCPICGGWHITSQEMPEFNPATTSMVGALE